MTSDNIQGVIRAVLAMVGGILISKGLIDQSMLGDVTGAIVTLSTAAWSIFHKQQQAAAADAKVAAAVANTGAQQSANG